MIVSAIRYWNCHCMFSVNFDIWYPYESRIGVWYEWHVEILAEALLKMMSRLEVKCLLTNVLVARYVFTVTIVSYKVSKTCNYKFHKVCERLNLFGVTIDITDGGLGRRYIPRKNLYFVVRKSTDQFGSSSDWWFFYFVQDVYVSYRDLLHNILTGRLILSPGPQNKCQVSTCNYAVTVSFKIPYD
jgi:hypothetical protein